MIFSIFRRFCSALALLIFAVLPNPAQQLDSGFGLAGVASIGFSGINPFGSNDDRPVKVFNLPDGKILLVANHRHISPKTGPQPIEMLLVRRNGNGTADSVSPNGIIGGIGNFAATDAAMQPDGKIVVVGYFYQNPQNETGQDWVIARFNQSGTLDNVSGFPWYVTRGFGNNIDTARDVEIQPDGKIVVLGTSFNQSANTLVTIVARYNSNAAPDSSFGSNGEGFLEIYDNGAVFINTSASANFGGRETWRGINLRNNGNIYVSGMSVQIIFSQTAKRELYTILEYSASGQLLNKNFSRHTPQGQIVSPGISFYLEGLVEQPDGKILLYGAHGDGGFNGPPYNVLLARYLSISALKDANPFYDYNFDGVTEYAVYRPNPSGFGTWHFLNGADYTSVDYGLSGDVLAPGDYNGDGMQDLGVFRPGTGEWITGRVYLNNCAPMGCVETIQFGASGDIPAPGDYDGDAKTDRAVFRPSVGDWYILLSSGGARGLHFGQNGDKPVTGDYDGDGKSDIAVIRRLNGNMFWYILQSSDNQFVGLQFGIDEDKTVAADYNGDAKTEIAVWRPSSGTWYKLANYTDFSAAQFGANGDVPEPADYDKDRKADFAVFRPSSGVHYVLQTSNGNSTGTQFGAATDIPIASAYVR
jgi:uncharacterized delta-60 repeat protein